MRYLFFAKLLLISTALLAQSGNFFLSHYAPSNKTFDNVCFDIVQDDRGVFYYASQTGIMQFDGRNWDMIQADGSVFSLRISPAGSIFWSGSNGFGKIIYDNKGAATLQNLSGEKAKDIFQILTFKDRVYFLGEQTVFILEETTNRITTIQSTNLTGSFTGIFDLLDAPYVNTERGEIYQIENEKLKRADPGLIPGTEVLSSARLENTFLTVTGTSQVFLYERNAKAKEVLLQDSAYAEANVIINGIWVNKQLIALGTLRGGVLFVNPLTGETQEIVSYATGLPDNEVFALMRDRNQNIWVAHDYGFTRIAPYFPLRSFSHYPGLQGNILCASSFQNNVYVGTSLGLFKLEKEDYYEETVYFVDVEISSSKVSLKDTPGSPAITTDKSKQHEIQPEPESKRRGFFRFLKRKKDTENIIQDSTAVPSEKQQTNPPAYRTEKRTQKVLRSSQFVYKKIKGIDAKVTQLSEVNHKLIATGLAGAYEVNALQATAILEQPVRFSYVNESTGMLLLSTYDDEVRALLYKPGGWHLLNMLTNLDDQINFIFQGGENELWLCALDKVYRLEFDQQEVSDIQTISLPAGNIQEAVGIQWHERIVLANADGFYSFDRPTSSFIRIDSLPSPHVYFASDGNVWYRDSHQWNTIGQNAQSNLQLLNLFNDLRFIASDVSSESLWLVSSNNELFKFFGAKINPYESAYALFVKSVKNGDKQLEHVDQFEIDQTEGVLSFAVVQPDYVNPQAVEYRYFLKGLHKEWTDWSVANNVLNFPYLPAGKYTLQVEAKNIFGKIAAMEPLEFDVQPPYWKRSWFYALEFAIFASLVVLSFRLSNRYRIVSRLLSLLTIILLIEFIQTVIGATFSAKNSPVSDFFIQVVVALLILPVEEYLRNLMLRSFDPSRKWYHLMLPKSKTNDSLSKNADQ